MFARQVQRRLNRRKKSGRATSKGYGVYCGSPGRIKTALARFVTQGWDGAENQ